MELITQDLGHGREAYAVAEQGMTCAQLVEQCVPLLKTEYVMVTINGHKVPAEYWSRVKPKASSVVRVSTVPRGGDGGGKSILALVASIAIAIFAPYLAGLVGPMMGIQAGTLGMQMLTAAIGMVGNLLIGMLFRPPTPGKGNSGGKPLFQISGQSNAADPYGPVRRSFGRVKLFPTVAAAPYAEIFGDDSYLVALYDVGAGDYEVTDLLIGSSAIDYFQNAQYKVHRNTMNPELLWYRGARHTDPYNVKLPEIDQEPPADGWFEFDTAFDCDHFVINLLFPSGLTKVDSEGQYTDRTAKWEIEWREKGGTGWYAIRTAYRVTTSREMDTDQIPVVHAQVTTGNAVELYRDKTRIDTGYPAGATVLSLLAFDGSTNEDRTFIRNGVTYTITNTLTQDSEESVTISPALAEAWVIETSTYSKSSGWTVVSQSDITVALEVFSAGGEFVLTDHRVVQLPVSIEVAPTPTAVPGKQYSVRIRQTEGKSNDRNKYGDLHLTSVTSISAVSPPVALRNAHTLVEMRIQANDQLSGTVDNLSCIAHSYLNVRRGGQWFYELSNNPAWALLEVLQGSMNKRPVPNSRIDMDSFEAWADYCDSLHPVHAEKLAEFDHTVDYNTTIFALAQSITAAGRASLIPGDGRLKIVIDQPQTTPVQVFTPHNSKGFSGSRTFIDIPHALRIQYYSRDTWKMEERIVYNDGYDINTATVFENMESIGVTRNTQVWRDGRYRMAQGIHRQEQWVLDVDMEHLVATRGDMVHVAHDVPRLGGLPARIKHVTYDGNSKATQWTLTEPVSFEVGKDYGYTIRTLAGTILQGELENPPVDEYTVRPVAPVAGITVGDLHVWGEMMRITYPFLIGAVNPQPDLAAKLTLVPYAGDAIFNADTGTIPPYDPPVDADLGVAAPPAVNDVRILQRIQYVDRRPLLAVQFDWMTSVGQGVNSWEVWGQWDLNPEGPTRWALLGRTTLAKFFWIRDIDIGIARDYPGSKFCVKVLAVSQFGNKVTLNEAPSFCGEMLGDYSYPSAPPVFDLDLKRDTIAFSWLHPTDPDIDYYEIRYDPNLVNPNYAKSTIVAARIPYPAKNAELPARLGTYFIKSVDTSGNRSQSYSAAYTPGINLWNINELTVVDDEPDGWDGNLVNFERSPDGIRTLESSPGLYQLRAEYYYAEPLELGAVYQTRFTSKINASIFDSSSFMSTWVPMEIADPIAGELVYKPDVVGAADSVSIWHEVRWVRNEGGILDYGEWKQFLVTDYTGQTFEFRLVVEWDYPDPEAPPYLGVEITDAFIEVAMPDRIDGRYDVICPPGGVYVAYDPPFKDRPVIAITADTVVQGDSYQITASSADGFNIEFYDKNQQAVQRQFDWLAKGYGAQQGTQLIGYMYTDPSVPKPTVITAIS